MNLANETFGFGFLAIFGLGFLAVGYGMQMLTRAVKTLALAAQIQGDTLNLMSDELAALRERVIAAVGEKENEPDR